MVRKEEENVLELHTSPANPLIYGGRLHMGVSVNQEVPVELCITGEKYKGGEPMQILGRSCFKSGT